MRKKIMQATVYDQTITKLKEAGIRVTPQRIAIIQYLIASTAHPTAEQIHDDLAANFPHMSVATVYNNLGLLTDLGLVEEMNVADTAVHFDFPLQPHYHAVCTNCGKIVDFSDPQLSEVQAHAAKETGFKVTAHHLEVYGLCPECQAKLAHPNKA
jgi:Fur family peroxide stress response transcriptional regulator